MVVVAPVEDARRRVFTPAQSHPLCFSFALDFPNEAFNFPNQRRDIGPDETHLRRGDTVMLYVRGNMLVMRVSAGNRDHQDGVGIRIHEATRMGSCRAVFPITSAKVGACSRKA